MNNDFTTPESCPDGWGPGPWDTDERAWIEKAYSSGDLRTATEPERGQPILSAQPAGYISACESYRPVREAKGIRRYARYRRLAS